MLRSRVNHKPFLYNNMLVNFAVHQFATCPLNRSLLVR
jgi:hypothetical protein